MTHKHALLRALHDHIRAASPGWNNSRISAFLKVSRRTLESWGTDPDKYKAAAVHTLARLFRLGGLTFTDGPLAQTEFTDFDSLVTATQQATRINSIELARVLGIASGALAKVYRVDAAYAVRNLTLTQLRAWAQAVGFGEVTTVIKDLASGAVFVGFNDATLHTPAPVENTVTTGRVRALVACYPETPGLHLPLTYLLRVLKDERVRQALALDELPHVAPPDVLEQWESGYILQPPRRVADDLTLGALNTWAQTLGFGRVLCPLLGYDWPRAMDALVATVRVGDGLDIARLGVLWGCGPGRGSAILRGAWRDIPAAFFEYLAVWAYADGLAFEHGQGRRGWTPEQARIAFEQARERLHARVNRMRFGSAGGSMELRRMVSQQGGYARFAPVEVGDCSRANTK